MLNKLIKLVLSLSFYFTNIPTFLRLYRELGFWVVIKRNLRKISLEYELFSFATDTVRNLVHS